MDVKPDTEKIKYRDRWFRLTAAILVTHIIIVYGEPESSFELLLTKDYYTAFAGSFPIAILLIEWVYQATSFLDRRYEWIHKSIRRVFAQILAGLIIPGLLAFFLAFAYFWIRDIDILKTTYLNYDFPFILLMLCLCNVYYLAYYFYLKWSIAEKKASDLAIDLPVEGSEREPDIVKPSIEKEAVFMVSKGSASVPVPSAGIAYFYREDEINYLRTFDGEDIFVSQSLDDIFLQLDDRLFFRANRQMIIHAAAVGRVKGIEYGKLDVTLIPAYKESIIVSQNKARSFRQWIDFNRYQNKKTATSG